jgi:hypothetical protein
MIRIDSSRRLRSHADLKGLVQAVVDAGSEDETDWVEWKTDLDLDKHEGQGTVARHILGFANRQPEDASRHVGGCGYLVVGAEPGRAPGIRPVDPANLEPQVQQFLDPLSGPVWYSNWVEHGNAHVLVVVVDPPTEGDPIHTLQKAFDKYRAGDIFVRRPGRTERANPTEVLALTRRAHSGSDRLLVGLELADSQRAVPVVPDVAKAVDELVEKRTAPLFAALRARPATGGEAGFGLLTARVAESLGQSLTQSPEPRSESEYLAEVEDYARELRERAPAVFFEKHLESDATLVLLEAVNSTESPFRDVEYWIYIAGDGVEAHEDPPYAEHLPRPPRKWGPKPLFEPPGMVIPNLPSMSVGPLGGQPSIDIRNGGSAELHFPAIDIGPLSRRRLLPFHLAVPRGVDSPSVTIEWEARSMQLPGVSSGSIEVPVRR